MKAHRIPDACESTSVLFLMANHSLAAKNSSIQRRTFSPGISIYIYEEARRTQSFAVSLITEMEFKQIWKPSCAYTWVVASIHSIHSMNTGSSKL